MAASMDSKTLGQLTGNRSGFGSQGDRVPTSQLQAVGRSTVSAQGRGPGSKQTTGKGFFTSSQLANNANLGRLPTLGLNMIKAEDFGDDSRNPFYVQPNTEKMLVVRELEREFKDLNKFEKDALRIYDK